MDSTLKISLLSTVDKVSVLLVSVALAEAINTNKIKIDKKIEKNLFDFIDYHTLSFFY